MVTALVLRLRISPMGLKRAPPSLSRHTIAQTLGITWDQALHIRVTVAVVGEAPAWYLSPFFHLPSMTST